MRGDRPAGFPVPGTTPAGNAGRQPLDEGATCCLKDPGAGITQALADIEKGTRRLLVTAALLTDAQVREPSRPPGWTRGHMLTLLPARAAARPTSPVPPGPGRMMTHGRAVRYRKAASANARRNWWPTPGT